MRRPGRLAIVVSAVALTGLLTACGGATPQAAPRSASAAVVPPSATPSPTPTPTGPPVLTTAAFATTVAAAMGGVTTYDSAYSTDDPQNPWTGTGSFVATPGAEAAAVTVDMGPAVGTMQLVLVGGKTYMSIEKVTGARFFVLDTNKKGSPFSAADIADMTRTMNPATEVTDIQPAITAVATAGAAETLDGVQAQPYDLTLDTTKLSASAKSELTATPETLPATVTVRMWVGPDNVIRKDSRTIDGVTDVTTFSHYGAGAPVVAPAAAQLVKSPF